MPSTTLRAFHWSSVNSCPPLAIHPFESMSAIIADESTYSSKHKQFLSCSIRLSFVAVKKISISFSRQTLHKSIKSALFHSKHHK